MPRTLILIAILAASGIAGNVSAGERQDANPAQPAQPAKEEDVFRAFLFPYLQRFYGPLFANAADEYPETKRNSLLQIFVDREVGLSKIRRSIHPQPNEEKQEIDSLRAAFDVKIEQNFGADTLTAIKRYEAAEKWYRMVNTTNMTLIFKGAPLSAGQFHHMVDLLAAHSTNDRLIGASDAELDKYISKRRQMQTAILKEAATHLSPVQLDEFKLEFEIELRHLRYFQLRNSKSGQESGKANRP